MIYIFVNLQGKTFKRIYNQILIVVGWQVIFIFFLFIHVLQFFYKYVLFT